MKTFLLIITTIILMSFKSDNEDVWRWPCFFMTYDKPIPKNCEAGCELYSNGIFNSNPENYFSNIDSVAVKYVKYKDGTRTDHTDTYTNYYSRKSDTSWNKYDGDKHLLSPIYEYRSDTFGVQYYKRYADVIYYKVK